MMNHRSTSVLTLEERLLLGTHVFSVSVSHNSYVVLGELSATLPEPFRHLKQLTRQLGTAEYLKIPTGRTHFGLDFGLKIGEKRSRNHCVMESPACRFYSRDSEARSSDTLRPFIIRFQHGDLPRRLPFRLHLHHTRKRITARRLRISAAPGSIGDVRATQGCHNRLKFLSA